MSVGLTIKGLRKRYGRQEALAGVDLEICPGEFFCLVGPSGCGKTTLLRCVAGFARPDAGEIMLDGERLDPLPPHRRGLGMVFQNYALFPHLSVRENVAYGLRARRLPGDVVAKRVEQALAQVRLAHRASSFPGMLSGGEQQRVATARALAIAPRLLLMDEPLSNLDAKLRVEMREEIRGVQRALGITTLYVTHDQEEALALADRIAVMNGGALEQTGTPLEIYRNPATPFVAGFIGHTNFLAGVVEAVEGGKARVRVLSGAIRVTAGDLSEGDSVTVALRPERFGVASAAAPGTIAGVITGTSFLGAITRLQVETAAGRVMVELHGHYGEGLKPGAQVHLAVQSETAIVFRRAAEGG
jgi:ABC-type Fe3+/spermidine/putrescine transport system ATPase subunit